MEPEPDKSNLNVLQAHVKGVQSTLYLSIMSTLVSRNLKTSLRQHMKDTHLLTLNIDRDCHIHNLSIHSTAFNHRTVFQTSVTPIRVSFPNPSDASLLLARGGVRGPDHDMVQSSTLRTLFTCCFAFLLERLQQWIGWNPSNVSNRPGKMIHKSLQSLPPFRYYFKQLRLLWTSSRGLGKLKKIPNQHPWLGSCCAWCSATQEWHRDSVDEISFNLIN